MDAPGRYSQLSIRIKPLPDGTKARYRARRFLPQPGTLPLKRTTVITDADRIDLLAVRHLGSPAVWWRICDANDVLSPIDLERAPGRAIRIPDDAPHLNP